MRRPSFRTICGAVSIIGFMLLLETASASDCNMIPLWRAALQCAVGLVMFGGGAYLGGFMQ